MPTQWVAIRKALEKEEKRNWIPIERFTEICKANGILDRNQRTDLLNIFRTLGFLLNYKNPKLKGMVILNREWVTDALYRVLDDELVSKNGGGSG